MAYDFSLITVGPNGAERQPARVSVAFRCSTKITRFGCLHSGIRFTGIGQKSKLLFVTLFLFTDFAFYFLFRRPYIVKTKLTAETLVILLNQPKRKCGAVECQTFMPDTCISGRRITP